MGGWREATHAWSRRSQRPTPIPPDSGRHLVSVPPTQSPTLTSCAREQAAAISCWPDWWHGIAPSPSHLPREYVFSKHTYTNGTVVIPSCANHPSPWSANPVLLSLLTDSLARSSIKHLRVHSRCLIGCESVRWGRAARPTRVTACGCFPPQSTRESHGHIIPGPGYWFYRKHGHQEC